MAVQTAEEYYENEDNWGNYQFLNLSDFINELLVETTDSDSYLHNTPRSKLLVASKNGIRKLNKEIRKTVLAIEMTVGEQLYIVLPQDYVDWVRVSVVTDDFKLQTLNVNKSIITAIGYLQDNNADILFDEDGGILTADSSNTYNHPYTKYEFTETSRGGQFELDTSILSRYGEFVVDENKGTIAFSSNLEDREVVVEYISDGLQMANLLETEIRFNKLLKDALTEYVYSECISKRRNVPANEKQRAKASFKTELHKAKVIALDLDINEIMRATRTSTIQP
jgi:hypothetical protein